MVWWRKWEERQEPDEPYYLWQRTRCTEFHAEIISYSMIFRGFRGLTKTVKIRAFQTSLLCQPGQLFDIFKSESRLNPSIPPQKISQHFHTNKNLQVLLVQEQKYKNHQNIIKNPCFFLKKTITSSRSNFCEFSVAHPLVPAPPAGNLRRGQRCPSGPSATGLFPVGGPGPDCNQENWPWMCFSGDFLWIVPW